MHIRDRHRQCSSDFVPGKRHSLPWGLALSCCGWVPKAWRQTCEMGQLHQCTGCLLTVC